MKKRWYICTVEKQKRSLKENKDTQKYFKNKFVRIKKKFYFCNRFER